MKKLLPIFLAVFTFVACNNSTNDNAGIIQRTDDFSTKVKQISEDYTSANYDLANEIFSDTIQIRYNLAEFSGKENLIAGFKSEHEIFTDIEITNQYAHTNYFSDGAVWTNHWMTWSGTAKHSGEKLEMRVHQDFKWEEGKIVVIQAFYSDNNLLRLVGEARATE